MGTQKFGNSIQLFIWRAFFEFFNMLLSTERVNVRIAVNISFPVGKICVGGSKYPYVPLSRSSMV